MADSRLVATWGQWVQGARPRTLSAAFAPVLVGTAVAWYYLADILDPKHAEADGPALPKGADDGSPFGVDPDSIFTLGVHPHASTSITSFVVRAVLALVVALALQIGVNYANDYSDGIRGTDEERVGPVRLVGQHLAEPSTVKGAAFVCFAIAAVGGLALVLLTHAWWLLLVGLAAIIAAWFYTGGSHPYGYAGLGELFVFIFFGLVAVAGTTYVQTLALTPLSLFAGVACGSLSVAILLANNLRDIPTDRIAGKHTLAVRLGDRGTRIAYSLAIAAPFLITVGMAIGGIPWALTGLLAMPLAIRPARTVRGGAIGGELVPVLAGTGLLLLGYAVTLSAGLAIAELNG
jgi:1,4-dihydroxy-2-naphthoate octaprenyltransferase